MKDVKCPLCNDEKHLMKDGRMTRCSCLLQEVLQRKLSQAGVFIPYEKISYNYIAKTYKDVNPKTLAKCEGYSERLLSGILPYSDHSFKSGYRPVPCFYGNGGGIKEVFIACLLKDALLGGYDVVSTSIDDIAKRYFDKENPMSVTQFFFQYQVLHVEFGNELTINSNSNFLRDVIRLGMNSDCFLILSTHYRDTDLTNGVTTKYANDITDLLRDKTKIPIHWSVA